MSSLSSIAILLIVTVSSVDRVGARLARFIDMRWPGSNRGRRCRICVFSIRATGCFKRFVVRGKLRISPYTFSINYKVC